MDFLDQKIEAYTLQHTEEESPLLKKISRETYSEVLMPRMLSGHLQGRVLSMFSHMIKPKNILEIGTYTGYSAICLSEGLATAGKLFTIDINEELETRVRGYFEEAGLSSRITYKIGNALTLIPELKGNLDIVFIDADKENYCNYYDLVFNKVNKGGYIIADNVLWSGKVIEEKSKNDKDTKAIIEYSKKVHEDKRVQNILLPVRDGLMIARKI